SKEAGLPRDHPVPDHSLTGKRRESRKWRPTLGGVMPNPSEALTKPDLSQKNRWSDTCSSTGQR
ncbi:MAG TPA: hypothetical protein VF749_18630, partial [Candidatus Acidoferrum sp.]